MVSVAAPRRTRTARAALYTSDDIIRLSGVSYRQLDYWVRVGVLRTAYPVVGSGSRRQFHGVELEVVRVVAALRELGLADRANGATGSDIVREIAEGVRAGRSEIRIGSVWVVISGDRVMLSVPKRHD